MKTKEEILKYIGTWNYQIWKQAPEFIDYWATIIMDILEQFPDSTLKHAYLDIGQHTRNNQFDPQEIDNNLAILIINMGYSHIRPHIEMYLKEALSSHFHEGIDAYNFITSQSDLILTCDAAY